MNIGVYVRTFDPTFPAGQRFQDAVLEGLRQVDAPQFHFVIFSHTLPADCHDSAQISYVAIASASSRQAAWRRVKLLAGGISRRILRTFALSSSKAYRQLTEWLEYEPPYFNQLRSYNIRLIWNLSTDVLPSFLPYIMVTWDVNNHIHKMFPEFSFAHDSRRVHDLYQSYDRYLSLMQRASYVLVGTEVGKRDIIATHGIYPDRIRVVPFPTPKLPEAMGTRADAVRSPYLFFPGRFWPHKNHIVLLRALRLLKERWGRTINCVFSGIDNGNLGFVLQSAKDLEVSDQVQYFGNATLGELSELYRGAEALVYCSIVGPDNLPPLEAMSLGCPVITTEYPGAREQCKDAALFFEATNEIELAELIQRLLRDPILRKELVERGYKRAAAWTSNDYANAVVNIMSEFALLARNWDRGDAPFTFVN